MMRRADAPLTIFDRLVVWTILAALAALVVLDLVTAARLLAFASSPPPVHQAEAPARYETTTSGKRSRRTALRVALREGPVILTTGPSTLFGTPHSGVDSQRVLPDTVAKVAWIDAPSRLLGGDGAAHYPIRVEQSGRVLLDIDGAAGIARAELTDVLIEDGLLALLLAGFAGWLVPLLRRDARKMAAARAAWHQRHGR